MRCCANCVWSISPNLEEDIMKEQGYSYDDPNRPKAGDCVIGMIHDENFYCKEHDYIDGMEEYEQNSKNKIIKGSEFMPGTFKMEESFVIATILKTKNKYFHEKYVTYEELNYIQNELIQIYKENNINIWITNEINDYYYKVDEVILPNKDNNITIQDLETNYIGLCPSLEILKILWNEKFILTKLLELKEKQLKKILNNQKKLTKRK